MCKKPSKVLFSFVFIASFVPVCTHAQSFVYLTLLVRDVAVLIFNPLLKTLVVLAFAVFVWGLVVFIVRSGNDKSIEEGRKKMLWGVIALFVITAIWGIIALTQRIIGVRSDNVIIHPPAIPKHDDFSNLPLPVPPQISPRQP